MLTREVMGLLALGILWVNTLLIALAAWKQMSALVDRRSRLRLLADGETGYGVVKGTIARGKGEGGTLAVRKVDQIGHQAASNSAERRAILFHDSVYGGEIFGGALSSSGHEVLVASFGSDASGAKSGAATAEVWVAEHAMKEAGECASEAQFDGAFDASKKAKGYPRRVESRLRESTDVWVAGDVTKVDGVLSIAPSREHGLLVSSFEPASFLSKKISLCLAAILGILGGASLVTVIALRPPVFGTISIVGGALGLVFFLLVQPAGTALRDAVRLPHLAFVRGEWIRGKKAEHEASDASKEATSALRSAAGE